jgi:hypothetical protein
MKSLEEAIGTVIRQRLSAYDSLAESIRANPTGALSMRRICNSLIESIKEGDLVLDEALLVALVNGVVIGIEMEKQEWPKSSQ